MDARSLFEDFVAYLLLSSNLLSVIGNVACHKS